MKIDINAGQIYPVFIENGILSQTGEKLTKIAKPNCKIMVISDSNVFPLYGEKLLISLKDAGFKIKTFTFAAGEVSKSLHTVYEIYESMATFGMTRSDYIINLGGGVAGDMGGFAAATYLRGIPFVQVPTSLLSQVDASVGGKTGVDLPFGKNLVGAFHQPTAVFIDPLLLRTLPRHFFSDGMGEVIKYACIDDLDLFEALEDKSALTDLLNVITKCIKSKKNFVETDTKDTGKRMILNFGHTFGHALEKLHNFQGLAHGEAVGIGMILAAQVGEHLGLTAAGTSNRIKSVLELYNLPTGDDFTNQQIAEATNLDKKSDGDILNLILIQEIGKSFIHKIRRDEIIKYM